MSGPFPGMDPYLESPEHWRNVHARLITYSADALQPQLLPKYAAVIEDRVTLGAAEGLRWPDFGVREQPQPVGGVAVAVRPIRAEVTVPDEIDAPELGAPARLVTVRDLETQRLVTAIEVLSPWNKVGQGWTDYRRKQSEYLHSPINLVEIDLLRQGRHTVAAPRDRVPRSDYRICIHQAGRAAYGLISLTLREPLPAFNVPLQGDDEPVVLDLGSVMARVYELGAFAYLTDYSCDPNPPLPSEGRDWAQQRIAAWRLANGAGRADP